jgi:membrane associated rhomboid family serine protease
VGLLRSIGRSPVTLVLLGINIVAFLVELATPDAVIEQYGQFGLGVAAGQYHRLLTSAYVHLPSAAHIVGNMVTLAVLGSAAESLLGRARLVLVYLLSAFGGAALSYQLQDPQVRAVGASGAIFGLCGLVAVTWPRQNRRWSVVFVALMLVSVPLSLFVVVDPLIDTAAHLGGLVTGALLGAVLVHVPRGRRVVRVASVLIVTAVIVGMVGYRSTVVGAQVHSLAGTYLVYGPQTSCTGYAPDLCGSPEGYEGMWTISGCTDQACWITAGGWAAATVLTRNEAGRWTATATKRPELLG